MRLSQVVLKQVMDDFESRHDGVLDAEVMDQEIMSNPQHPWRVDRGGDVETNVDTAAHAHRIATIYKCFRRGREPMRFGQIIVPAPRNVPIIGSTPTSYEHVTRSRENRSEDDRRQIILREAEKIANQIKLLRLKAAALGVGDALVEAERMFGVYQAGISPTIDSPPAGSAD